MLQRLTRIAYNQLWELSKHQPVLWTDPDTDFKTLLVQKGVSDLEEDLKNVHYSPIELTVPANVQNKIKTLARADKQASAFHQSFTNMTPVTATDSRIWARFSHFEHHQFTLNRFPPKKDITNWIRSHWFAETGKRPHSMNASARLWWIGHLAETASQYSNGSYSAEEVVEHFAENPQRFHVLLFYPVLQEGLVLAEFIRLLLREAKYASKSGYELIARRINLLAGSRLLGCVPQMELRKRFQEITFQVLSDPINATTRKAVSNPKTLRVLSLGAGVQSSVLALMCEKGSYDLEKPDFAIFADTGWEPPQVYEHLEWLKNQLSYPVITVSAGSLRNDIISGRSKDGYIFLGIPGFVVNPDGSHSILKRQCTSDYKLNPIYQKIRNYLGIEKGKRAPKDVIVEMWLGISTDESERMKPGLKEYVVNKYPLITRGFGRNQLQRWFTDNYPDRILPRSACIGCPYHSNEVWTDMKNNQPDLFAEAVYIDHILREGEISNNVHGTAYLHPSRIPLEEVDFTQGDNSDGFVSECEGMCGI